MKIRGILLFLLICISQDGVSGLPDSERQALVFFYDAANGDSWTNNTNWKVGDPCDDNWFGVICKNANTTVDALSLPNNNLDGVIFQSIGDLVNITGIDLSGNNLFNPPPTEMQNLTQLDSLNLANNILSGMLPSEVTSLPVLRILDLNQNNLVGALPSSWSSELVMINLSDNNFTTIPPELGSLPLLDSLRLNGNQIAGQIPPELGGLADLLVLDLRRNRIIGPIPDELGNMTSLQSLRLASNILTGDLPASMVNLTNLLSLDISFNALFTTDPALDTQLDGISSDWSLTQTVAPTNFAQTSASITSATFTWQAIEFSSRDGFYKFDFSQTQGGPYTQTQQTVDKTITEIKLTSLQPETTYYVVARTVTNPHSANANTVFSEFSPEFSVVTPGQIIHEDGFEVIE
jgi:hypothetical protein